MDCYAARLASLQEENPELTRLAEFHAPFDGLVGQRVLCVRCHRTVTYLNPTSDTKGEYW